MAVTHGPGFRFHPTDQELVIYYLKRKRTGKIPSCYDYIGDVDIYKFEPWDLPSMSKLKSGDLEWFFFTLLDKKYGNGSRTNRATDRGFWKTTGNDRAVKHGERTVGMKKTLVYHSGRAPRGTRTNWVMHEYRLVDPLIQDATVQDAVVLCRIFEKSGSGPKNGESHGAPFREEDWATADDEGVHPVPAVADENHLNQLPPEVAVVGFIEQEDLEQKLEPSATIGNDGFPSYFHHGECSSHPKHSQVFVDNQKPLGGSSGMSDLRNGHSVLNNAVINGDHGELSHEDTPLNFNDPIPDLDVLSWDPSGYPPIVDNENYFEGMDLVMNLGEVNPAEANSSITEMLNEYITYSDDDDGDISKYISYSPQSIGSESPIPDQGPPVIQQNVEGETNDISVASKHVFEAQSSNEASLELNPQATELVSGDTNPIVKQANKLLASIPAAPAFASEFPTKEFALGLHPAAQSSNSAHVTAGMISITDITLRGNVMDWRVGKNAGFDPTMSTGFSQPSVYSAALMPISGLVSRKTAFMLSHGWIFLMGFSVLILSLSFKIGSFMYTGK